IQPERAIGGRANGGGITRELLGVLTAGAEDAEAPRVRDRGHELGRSSGPHATHHDPVLHAQQLAAGGRQHQGTGTRSACPATADSRRNRGVPVSPTDTPPTHQAPFRSAVVTSVAFRSRPSGYCSGRERPRQAAHVSNERHGTVLPASVTSRP